ncbi:MULTISPECIES: glycosyltransferase [unclassified Synechocystis]|uniref:glycosyltransferase n=1 Tax=unclassified Synechocystis TaxID=2640012 RepID=UPI00040298E9|nr:MULTISPECIES: glycosyltransferase [unclassified Synechocystis]AIE76001.1 Glycosyl transferase, group 2 family protein [Synechocystis sp. PCC 6714]MCT0255090.1 glycosyltransferase [Synechocystis sp. CS-94]
MKIAFLDPIAFDYSTNTVYTAPLGGTQSSLCYLTNEITRLGHDVFLINNISSPTVTYGVACLPISCVTNQFWQAIDIIVCCASAHYGETLRQLCGSNVVIIFWNHHAHDQPAVQRLVQDKEREAYDAFFCISSWQAGNFIERFGIEQEKVTILRNAIGYNFEYLFDSEPLDLSKKITPITLAYTSTPFRGLNLLVDIFPKIREKFPNAELKVFSSMKVYQMSDEQDGKNFGGLYGVLSAIDGVEYVGSLSQPELAQALKNVSILIYPNTFPETSCIAVMEAMVSGCHVITSDLGALPETTAGFATLVPFNSDLEVYKQDFLTATIKYIKNFQLENFKDIEQQLNKQIEHYRQHYTWKNRAQEWIEKLYQIKGYRLFKQQKYEMAINTYRQAVDDFPESENFYFYLILCLILSELPEEALSIIINTVINSNFNNPDYFSQRLNGIIQKELSFLANINEGKDLELIQSFFQQLE